MPAFTFDKSVSLGDLGMFASGALVTVAMAVNLQAQVDQHESELRRIETAVQQSRAEIRAVEEKDNAARDSLRVEIKGDLREISGKLDRLIERESTGHK